MSARRKGWFAIPGLQDGDRSLEDQMIAVRPALAEAKGKTVLDLGCAEGLIGREFARAGALYVLGVEGLPEHVEVARGVCRGLPMEFRIEDLNEFTLKKLGRRFDIVLSLGIMHKLTNPQPGVELSARACTDLLLFRAKGGVHDGMIRSKHALQNTCDVHLVMKLEGFKLEKTIQGPAHLNESVEYWRRIKYEECHL